MKERMGQEGQFVYACACIRLYIYISLQVYMNMCLGGKRLIDVVELEL